MRKWVAIIAAIIHVPPGGLALLHMAGRSSREPRVRFVVLVGQSMLPTLKQGDGLVFARLRWREGDVVLADVGEADPVVKRVDQVKLDQVRLIGDNRAKSAAYIVPREKVMGRLLFRFGHYTGLAKAAPRMAPVVQK
jgi:hypothetical protein